MPSYCTRAAVQCGWGMAGITLFRAQVLSTAERWRFGRLSVFWQAQIVGWGLFLVLDMLNRLLTYKNVTMAIVVSFVVAPCLVALSTGLGAIYASQRIDNRLTPASFVLV